MYCKISEADLNLLGDVRLKGMTGRRLNGFLRLGFPLTCAGLGTWQLYRLRWKEAYLRGIQQALSEEACELDSSAILPFRKYRLTGSFDDRHVFFVGPRACRISGRPAYGYTVVRVFSSGDRRHLVNCGLLPRGQQLVRQTLDREESIEVMKDDTERVRRVLRIC